MDCSKKENETQFEYVMRLVEGKANNIYDIDYTELFKLAFNVELASDEGRKRYYGLRMLLPFVDEQKIGNLTGDDLLRELELKKQEIEKEKCKVQTEKLTLSQMLREEARFELFVERAVDTIGKMDFPQVKQLQYCDGVADREGVLMFADAHYNTEFQILGLRGEIINAYNIEIFEERMARLLAQVVNIVQKEEMQKIKVFNLGDELDGVLRISQLRTLKYGLVESAINFAYFLAAWLIELSKHVFVDYYSTEGNHTNLRMLTGKKGDFPHENLSKVIDTLAKEILRDNPNVRINENGNDKIFTEVAGFKLLGIHGEEKNLMQAIRDFSFIYREDIDYLCTGHKHHANSINVGIGKGCIGVGSIIGVDDFSMTLKKTSNPTATFAIFEEGIGKTTEHTIYL